MTNKKKPTPPASPDSENYIGVGISFFVIGAALLASEATRMVGLPFLIIGATFFILGSQKANKPKRKK